jgi:hypothetical protein
MQPFEPRFRVFIASRSHAPCEAIILTAADRLGVAHNDKATDFLVSIPPT